MKKFSKVLALVLALSLALALGACSGNGGGQGASPTPAGGNDTPTSQAPAESQPPAESQAPSGGDGSILAADGTFEIAMITDKGDINDKSFNQGTWEGIKSYCSTNGKTCKYYKPASADTNAYVTSIEQAINDGAKVVVTPGFLFEEPIYIVQDAHPDVKFVLIDGNPHDASYADYKTASNTVGILFAEEQVGYLAGYAAVKDGYTKLGFLGGQAVPAVVRYGYGFVQGADAAAQELGVDVEMKYFYTGGFEATPEAQAMAAGWYSSGTEVIFACGGSVGNSAMAAAEANNGKVIGVDVDQAGIIDAYGEGMTVTSAMKGLAPATKDTLKAVIEDGNWANYAGKIETLGLVSGTDPEANYVQPPDRKSVV